MDSNTENNKYSFPRRCQPKEYTTWSPRNKGLPNIASSIEFPSKVQVNLPSNSPSGALLRGSKTNKAAAPVRLIPLSLETRGKENLAGTRKVSSFKLGLEATDKFEPSHVAVIMHDRPISEEFAKEAVSDKLTQKVTMKPFYNWLEKSFKLPTVTSPPSLCNNVPGDVSTKSKFKSKLLTARVTEEDIAKQLTKTRNSECTPKEVPLNELAQNSSQKKSGLSRYGSMTLAKAMPEVSSWQEHVNNKPSTFSKGIDSLNEKKIEQLNGREAAMMESILLSASKSPKNLPNFQAIQAIKDKDTPQKVSSSVSPQMTTMKMPGQSQENGQFQPRKLFQRKDAQTTVRSPLLFARKPANEATKPSTFSGQNTLTKVELPTPTLEEANGVILVPLEKSRSHNNNNVNNNGEYAKQQQQLSTTLPASRKSLLRKEHFHGEIRGIILKWKMGDFIGAGNFGQVYRAMEVESGKIIAVKTIASTNLVNKELLISLESELNILQKLQHKHIVQYIGHENIDNSLYIYLEYMSGGNITNIITKYGALPEKTVKVYAKQILAGLIYLHENKVIHKDIKGANILVDGDGTVKLADFGCSSQLEKTISNFDTFLANSLKGSIPWMAPEVVKETGYGRRSDIWSFGCTILEMATGKVPWSHYQFENPVAVLMKIALSEEIPLIPDSLSDELKNFLRLCLQRDPKKRPHAQDLINHPFLKN